MARKYVQYATTDKVEKINPKNKEHIRRYFVFKNMNLSESSKKSYESDFNQWLVYVLDNYNNQDLLEMDTEDSVDMIEDFIAFCTSFLGNNERRVQRRMSSISSFYLFLRKKRKIKENPIDFLERPKVGKNEKTQIKQTFLTEDQVNELRFKLAELGDTQLELYFEFSLSTMARVNAISNVKLDQLDYKMGRVADVLEKEGKIVTLFPSKRAMELVGKWIEERRIQGIESEYLFVTKYNGTWDKVKKGTLQTSWIKKIGKMIGIAELHSHDLRHSGSNILYHKGLSLEDVSALLNHSGTDVTRNHYLKMNLDAIQGKKEAFEI